ncbi:MAG: hypothetical protein WA584_23325 [Pyrinomonadaceae bacterium]
MAILEYYKGYEILPFCGGILRRGGGLAEFRANLGDAYRMQAQYGADTGVRNWTLSFENIHATLTKQSVEIDGTLVHASDYLWDLFFRSKREGTPFIVRDDNGQYYLAEFAESEISFTRKLVKAYQTSLNLTQVRLPGVSVFRPELLGFWGWYTDVTNTFTSSGWADSSGSGHNLVPSNAPTAPTIDVDPYGSTDLDVLKFHPTGSLGDYLKYAAPVLVKQIFILMKMREASFSTQGGVISGNGTTDPILVGANTTTKFFNFGRAASLFSYRFEKNSVKYEETDQQAPMNQYGLVYLKAGGDAMPLNELRIGIDGTDVARFAKMNVGEIAVKADTHIRDELVREYIEHVQTIWDY